MKHADAFSDFLGAGETILWIGRPGGAFSLTPTESGAIFYVAVLAAIFTVYWRLVGTAIVADPSGPLGLLTLLLLATAAIHVFLQGRAALRSFARRRTLVYCLTNERALIVEASRKKAWAFLNIAYDTPVALHEGRGGRGSISFGRRYDFDTEELPLFRGFTFYDIREFKKVAGLIEEMQERLAPTGGTPGIRNKGAGPTRA